MAEQAALSALFEGSYDSHNSGKNQFLILLMIFEDTTFPTYILGAPDAAVAFNFYGKSKVVDIKIF
jgi:hypothetical protein